MSDEGDAPLKAAVEGLHARFLLEAFLSAARREMTELQSRFNEMASEMRGCGVYWGGGSQPKETKEQLKEREERLREQESDDERLALPPPSQLHPV